MFILLGLFLNLIMGIFLHRKISNRLYNEGYTPAFSELVSDAVCLIYEIFGSYKIMVLYSQFVGDRRKVPIAFDRYLVIRLLSIGSLMAGVAIGYMLDFEYD